MAGEMTQEEAYAYCYNLDPRAKLLEIYDENDIMFLTALLSRFLQLNPNSGGILYVTWVGGRWEWLCQGFVKEEVFCFRFPHFYFRHGKSTSIDSQQTSTASQLSEEMNKVPLLLQNLGLCPQLIEHS